MFVLGAHIVNMWKQRQNNIHEQSNDLTLKYPLTHEQLFVPLFVRLADV